MVRLDEWWPEMSSPKFKDMSTLFFNKEKEAIQESLSEVETQELQECIADIIVSFQDPQQQQTHITTGIVLDDKGSRCFQALRRLLINESEQEIIYRIFDFGLRHMNNIVKAAITLEVEKRKGEE